MKNSIIFICVIFLVLLLFSSNSDEVDWPDLRGPYLGQKPPGMTPEIFAPGIVSTKDHIEMGFTCSKGGMEIYFSRSETKDIQSHFSIWVVRQKNGKWRKPEVAPFSGLYRDFAPFVTADGRYLMFYRMSSKKADAKRGTYMVEYKGGTWTEARYFFEGYCLNTADFKRFYFTTERQKNTNKDLAQVDRKNGHFLKPDKLKGNINSDEWEAHGYISPNGKFIIFDRIKNTYVSFLQKDNQWSKGYALQGKFHVPVVSGDGKYLFFEKNGDIYWVDASIIKKLRPKNLK